jgi:hypothetical protein
MQDLDNPSYQEVRTLIQTLRESQKESKRHFSAAWHCQTIMSPFSYIWVKECLRAQLHAFKYNLIWDNTSDPDHLRYQDMDGVGDLQGMGEGWEALEKHLTTKMGRYTFMSRVFI